MSKVATATDSHNSNANGEALGEPHTFSLLLLQHETKTRSGATELINMDQLGQVLMAFRDRNTQSDAAPPAAGTVATCGFPAAGSLAEPCHKQYWVVAALRHNKRKQMTSVLQPPQ